jgi:hypothetical protein
MKPIFDIAKLKLPMYVFLASLGFGLCLNACGTEVGNGWKIGDDKNREDKENRSEASPLEDQELPRDSADEPAVDNLDPREGARSEMGFMENNFRFLIASCASPFALDLKQPLSLVEVGFSDIITAEVTPSNGRWTFAFNGTSNGLTLEGQAPTAGQAYPVKIYDQGVLRSEDMTCSSVETSVEDTGNPNGSLTVYRVQLTEGSMVSDVKWFVRSNLIMEKSLEKVEIRQSSNIIATFQVPGS